MTDMLSDGMGSWQNLDRMRVNYQHETDGVFKVTNKSYKQPIERQNLIKNTSVLVKKYFRHSEHDYVCGFVAYVEDFYYFFCKELCCSWILFQQQRVSNYTQIAWQQHRPIIYINGHGVQKQLHCNRVAPTCKNGRQFLRF